MWETLITVASGGLGGLLRLAPEFLKGLDRKNERKHELAMMEIEVRIAEKRMEHEMRKVDAAMTIAEMDAISAAVKEQGQTAQDGGKGVIPQLTRDTLRRDDTSRSSGQPSVGSHRRSAQAHRSMSLGCIYIP